MSETPDNLRFSKDHEWVRLEDDGSVTVGITDHAQEALGELVFVEVPEPDGDLKRGDACAVVESVKAASDVYAPVAGRCIAANESLNDNPELVNESPYGDGWLLRIEPSDPAEIEELMEADAYTQYLAESDD